MRLGSLFDGSGGFPAAGIINGITPVWASEIEPYPLRVTAARLPEMRQLGDVTKINGAKVEPVDIITFGSPCQDLSVAGAQKGIHEGERSSLFFEAIRIIKEMREHDRANGRPDEHCRPRFAVWENVPGAFSSNKGKDFQAVLQAFCEVCGEAREGTAADAEGSARRGCGVVYSIDALSSNSMKSSNPHSGFHETERSKCLDTSGGNPMCNQGGNVVVVYPEVARTLTAEHDASPCIDRGYNVICLQGNGIDRADTAGCNGKGWRENECYTLNTIDRPAVVYAPNGNHCGVYEEADVSATLQTKYHYGSGGDAALAVYDVRGNGSGGVSPTLTGDHQNRVTDYTAVAVYDTTQITSPANYSKHKPGDPCHPLASQQHPPSIVYPSKTGALCANSHPGSYTGQDAFNDMLPVVPSDKPSRKYIVRRLTPLECCRLQGFPDWWEDGVEGSDSARYKMWGNGIALPCAVDVLRRIAKENVYGSHLD